MQEASPGPVQSLDRFVTEIPGLDEVLDGGLIRGGIYLIGGRPGTGKTVLGNHLAHNHGRHGGKTVVATVMAESHERMISHLSGFSFFDKEQLGRNIHYVSVYDELTHGDLSETLDVLRRLVRERKATLLVLDGAGSFGDFAPSLLEYRRFIYHLQAQLSALGCTVVLLIDYEGTHDHPLAGHVDGVFILEFDSLGLRDVRLMHVQKVRGVDFIGGRHPFLVSHRGIEIFPRLEARVDTTPPPDESLRRLAFGVPGLDDMLKGGVIDQSTTLVLGAPGAGKTSLGLHFILEGARNGERGLITTFHEAPNRLIRKAQAVGLPLGQYVESGLVRILWHPPLELLLDQWNQDVLRAVAEHKPHRFMLDGLTELQRLTAYPERLPAYLSALATVLRSRSVSPVLTAEATSVVGAPLDLPVPALAATVENAIMLRYVELRSQLHRLVSIIKTRESDYDTSIREFAITAHGVEVSSTFESAEAVLTGVARVVGGSGNGEDHRRESHSRGRS